MLAMHVDDFRMLLSELLCHGLLDLSTRSGLDDNQFCISRCSSCIELASDCTFIGNYNWCLQCCATSNAVCDGGLLFDLSSTFDNWNRGAASAAMFIRSKELSYEALFRPHPWERYDLSRLKVRSTEEYQRNITAANDHLKSIRHEISQKFDTLAEDLSLGTGLPLQVPAAASYSTAPPSASPDVTTAGSSAFGGTPGRFNGVRYDAAGYSSTMTQDPHMPSGGEYAQFAGGFGNVQGTTGIVPSWSPSSGGVAIGTLSGMGVQNNLPANQAHAYDYTAANALFPDFDMGVSSSMGTPSA